MALGMERKTIGPSACVHRLSGSQWISVRLVQGPFRPRRVVWVGPEVMRLVGQTPPGTELIN